MPQPSVMFDFSAETVKSGYSEPDDLPDYALTMIILFVYVFPPETWSGDGNREIKRYTRRPFSEELQHN